MIYVIESVLSAALMALFIFISYLLFNGAFSTQNLLIIIGIYIVWFILAFLAPFADGSILYTFADKIKNKSTISMIMGVIWAVIIILVSIYPWFKQPHNTDLIIIRALGNFFAFCSAMWAFLMVAMMGVRQ